MIFPFNSIIMTLCVIITMIGAIACCLSSMMRTATATELGAALASPSWIIDVRSLEKLLEDIAREKTFKFSSQQLKSFTSNYSSSLGSGACGIVYKGQIPNGEEIAVKVLNTNLDRRVKTHIMAEVDTIGRTNHINLVRLYGYCYDHSISALVYEYMENGSLDKYLFSEKQTVSWEKLHDIAVGTAKGLTYLHEECQQRIIHCDIKPANILLDRNFSAKVADFGLAKLCSQDITKDDSETGYRGTPGYSAPEFLLKHHPITYKCDVYSFGMLLFEIIGRRRNNVVDSCSDSLDWFPKHVWDEYEKGKLEAMIVGCGIEESSREKAERMAMVALWCVQDSPEARPPMSAVVKMLEGGVEIVPPPKPFRYLSSLGMDTFKAVSNKTSDSSSRGSHFIWYKMPTPIKI